jgi:hypothetical protein
MNGLSAVAGSGRRIHRPRWRCSGFVDRVCVGYKSVGLVGALRRQATVVIRWEPRPRLRDWWRWAVAVRARVVDDGPVVQPVRQAAAAGGRGADERLPAGVGAGPRDPPAPCEADGSSSVVSVWGGWRCPLAGRGRPTVASTSSRPCQADPGRRRDRCPRFARAPPWSRFRRAAVHLRRVGVPGQPG